MSPVHDYVIANGTGSAVRSDLNNALAAIVSNNSSSSEPATKYAYQWWADTTTGQLKLRNSANNGWVTIFELDGTMLMEDGTVSAPGLAFASDLNTGFFSGGADKINFATGGVERLEIGSSEVVFNDGSNDVDFRVESNGQTHMLFVDGGNDRVGIGETNPTSKLHVSGVSGTTFTLDSPNAYSSTASILMSQGRSEIKTTIDSGGGNPGGTLLFRTRNTSGSLVDAVTVTNLQRVGIGTSSPSTLMHLKDSADTYLTLQAGAADGNDGILFKNSAGTQKGVILFDTDNDYMLFSTNDTERMRIDSSGDVLIGKTSQSTSSPGVRLRNQSNVIGVIDLVKTFSGTASAIANYHSGTYVGGLEYTNTATSLATSSDIRLKTNIQDAISAVDIIKNVRVVSHDWLNDKSSVRFGFVAQELNNVVPEAVHEGDSNEEISKTWCVDYPRLVPILTKTLQEAIAKIETLETEVAALKAG